ncbi:MAG: hypothetical protein L3J20_13470 [Flavobacteriaceae bacterium]|nr:hypothetical protein [Flavobacteriaceae bacterium]
MKSRVNLIIKTSIFSAVIVSAIAVTFLHEYFPNSSQEYLEHKKNYKKIITNRDIAFDNLLNELGNNNITKEGFIVAYANIKTNSSINLKEYNKTKNRIKENDSYLGYTSFKNFLLGIGFPISGIVLSILFLNVVINHVQHESHKKFYLIVSFAFIACWGYWVSWSFLSFSQDPSRPFDFPKSYYNAALYILPTLIFISSFYLMKYYKSIEAKLKSIINQLIVFIIKSDKYIENKSTKTQHLKDYLTEFEKIVK